VADRLAATMDEPLAVGDDTYAASVSIGVAIGDATASPDSLLRDADSAMYASKSTRHRRATLFADEHRWRAVRTVQLEQALAHAVRNNELLLHVQPIVNLESGRLVAGETLVRWQHPERGLLLPGEWLDVAEASPLVHEIGRWVLRHSCRLAKHWADSLGADVPAVHVNVSSRQFERSDLCSYIVALLDEYALNGNALVLELTETELSRLDRTSADDLTGLLERGVTFAADDFGTGYSPLTQMTDLPLAMVKIDRTFVTDLGIETASQRDRARHPRIGRASAWR
jgi:predicted signal transduction protein with EAL and GGDEF domain